MGNQTSRNFDYTTFATLIEEGPKYLSQDELVWTNPEKRCLKEFLTLLKDPRLPWADSPREAFAQVQFAVPKSKLTAEIHAHVESPLKKDLKAFRSLHPKAQICWAHFYTLVMFMWTIHVGRPTALVFYESDLLYHVFRDETEVQHDQIELFLQALEKIQIVPANQPVQSLVKSRLILAPFNLVEGQLRNGTKIIDQPGPIEMGVYSSDGPVAISGINTTFMPEKCGRCQPSRHFVANELPEEDHETCGPQDTREYLDEILFRLDALCRFHKELVLR